MPPPTLAAYQDALQNPRLAFRDPELAGADVERTPLGDPKARTGGFAITYRLSNRGKDWAVRCFHHETPDLKLRYEAISAFLGTASSQLFVPFRYVHDGILVHGKRHPIVKMAWVQGRTLDAYVDLNVHDKRRIKSLADNFRATVVALERLGAAHGDLQHGNVLATDAAITLVDYDGMFVPGMATGRASETGHPNYQSPFRDGSCFGPGLDRFSAIVIDLALDALCRKPDLWPRYGAGRDNLLFQRADFVHPENSPLLRELGAVPGLAAKVDLFESLCRTPIDALPRLEDVLAGKAVAAPTRADPPLPTARVQGQYEVLRATEDARLRGMVGERVQVVGRVVNVAERRTRGGQPYAFVDFADWKTHPHSFRLVLWSDVLDQLSRRTVPLLDIRGRWVSIVGLVEQYGVRPQMVVDDPGAVRLLRDQE